MTADPGRGPWPDPDPGQNADAPALRRRKIIVGGVLGGIVVAGIVVAVVLSTTLKGDDKPSSPSEAAAKWGQAVLDHDLDTEHSLECSGGTNAAALYRLIQATRDTVKAGKVTNTGVDRWTVTLVTRQASYPVTVVYEHKDYLVC